jgi:hypothetical protein
MLFKEMSTNECEDLLARASVWRLGCTMENRPYIVPIHLGFAPGSLSGFATMGQKIDWMRQNPQVCVETDEIRSQTDWSSVLVEGRYEEFPDTAEYFSQRLTAQTLLEKNAPFWWKVGVEAGQTRQRFDRDHAVFFCIHIDRMTGRKALPDPK